jgi:hypothetical protein
MTRIGPAGRPPVPADGPTGVAAADPDVDLMLRAQQGDEGAFPELFRRLGPRVLQYVRRLIGSEARAEEITQDVFVQMFRFRERYRPESRLSTWVFTIATNLCLNELRRPERQLRVDSGGRPDGSGRRPADPRCPMRTPSTPSGARPAGDCALGPRWPGCRTEAARRAPAVRIDGGLPRRCRGARNAKAR